MQIRQARIFVCTGTPIQPHDTCGLEGLAVDFRWAVIPPLIMDHIGLEGVANNLHNFRKSFGLIKEAGAEPNDEEEEEASEFDEALDLAMFVPDETGVLHTLPDGVTVSLRMRFNGQTNRYVTEWLLPNRRPTTWHAAPSVSCT